MYSLFIEHDASPAEFLGTYSSVSEIEEDIELLEDISEINNARHDKDIWKSEKTPSGEVVNILYPIEGTTLEGYEIYYTDSSENSWLYLGEDKQGVAKWENIGNLCDDLQ